VSTEAVFASCPNTSGPGRPQKLWRLSRLPLPTGFPNGSNSNSSRPATCCLTLSTPLAARDSYQRRLQPSPYHQCRSRSRQTTDVCVRNRNATWTPQSVQSRIQPSTNPFIIEQATCPPWWWMPAVARPPVAERWKWWQMPSVNLAMRRFHSTHRLCHPRSDGPSIRTSAFECGLAAQQEIAGPTPADRCFSTNLPDQTASHRECGTCGRARKTARCGFGDANADHVNLGERRAISPESRFQWWIFDRRTRSCLAELPCRAEFAALMFDSPGWCCRPRIHRPNQRTAFLPQQHLGGLQTPAFQHRPGRPASKTRIVAHKQQVVRIDREISWLSTWTITRRLIRALDSNLSTWTRSCWRLRQGVLINHCSKKSNVALSAHAVCAQSSIPNLCMT